jgi:hypothetical protein
MKLPLGIKPLVIDKWKWTNAHSNFTQSLREGASFELTVSDPQFEKAYPTFKQKYYKTTENIQWLIKYAIDNKIRLRAMGSGWSLSKVAVCEGGIINTKKLKLLAPLDKTQVAQSYLDKGGDPTNLVFTQCGNTVININDLLENTRNPAKCLRASGGSNAQTIVGALSTGTHGAAFKFGALSEFVLGMHIVVGPNRHVWLERKSNQVTSDSFRTLIGAEVILDDDLFNSALISFGSFGFIHSVLIEVEPKYLLEQDLRRIPYNSGLEKAIRNGDFSEVVSTLNSLYPDKKQRTLQEMNDTLYHFELDINQYDFEKNNPAKGAYFRAMYKQPYQNEYPKIVQDAKGHTYGEDVLGLVQEVLDLIEKIPGKLELAILPKTVNGLFKTAYARPTSAIGTIGETFRNTIFRGQLFSGAYTFDRAVMPEVFDLVLEINKKIPFAGVIALRFVKGTKATLGAAMFENTCVLEMDGVDAKINHDFVEELTRQVETKKIKFGIHWGKINNVLTKERVRSMYGDEKVDKWLNHRKQLLSDEVRNVFNNEFLERCGLDQWAGANEKIVV